MKIHSVTEGPKELLRQYAQVMSLMRETRGSGVGPDASRASHARRAGEIYSEARAHGETFLATPIREISAATTSDANTGSLARDLVAQRFLELLKFNFPMLSRVASDFSAEQANYGQTLITRTVDVPNVLTYDADTGWASASSAVTHDVPVTMDKHKGVEIRFNQNIIGGTVRRLFDEFAPSASYALAKDIVDSIYGLITAGNFTNTATAADAASFGRDTVIDMGSQLTLRGVPQGPMNRTLLLNTTYFGALAKDHAIVTLSAYQRPEILEQGTLPDVHGFSVVDSPNLPTTGGLAGFGFSKSALILVTRLPGDYTEALPGASFGNVSTVTDPDLGISIRQVQYVNHQLGTANCRFALMYGVAKGQNNAGQRLTAI